MRIIYLHQYFKTPSMSGGVRSYEIARHMIARGHEVHMITSDRDESGCRWRETIEEGIHVHWYPIKHSASRSYRRRIHAFVEFAWAAARRAASISGDLIFATSTPLTIALPAVVSSRKQSIPMVFEVRDLWPEVAIAMGALRSRPSIAAARWLERFAYRNASHVIALTPGMKDGIVATGYPECEVSVIPNMSDVARFRVSDSIGREFRRGRFWLQDRPLVVYAGALGFVNGVDYLARLAHAVHLRDPEIRFLVVGSDREENTIRAVADQLGVLNRNFFMESAMTKAEIPALFSAADISTNLTIDLPELEKNCANKAFDTLAAGRALAVNSRGGWFNDLIRETGCGLELHPSNLEQAADRLINAIRDQGWMARAKLAAARLAEQKFNRDRLVRQWESVVVNVVRKHQQNQLLLPMTGWRIACRQNTMRRAA